MKKAPSDPRYVSVWPRGVLIALAAAGINLAILVLGRAAGVPFLKPAWDGSGASVQVTPGEVAIVSVVTVLVGVQLASVVAKRRPTSLRLVQALGVLFALMSLGGPLSLEATAATKALLASMHLICGGVYVAHLQAMIPARSPSRSGSFPGQVDHGRTVGAA